MKNFWVSFWAAREFGAFEIHSPWWFSGYRFKPGTKLDDIDDEDTTESSVCAAVRAESEEAAREFIYQSFDVRPECIEFRFVEERPADWSPYSDRFRQAAWMKW